MSFLLCSVNRSLQQLWRPDSLDVLISQWEILDLLMGEIKTWQVPSCCCPGDLIDSWELKVCVCASWIAGQRVGNESHRHMY